MKSVGFLSKLKYLGVQQEQIFYGNLSHMGEKHNLTNGTSGNVTGNTVLILVCGNVAEHGASV